MNYSINSDMHTSLHIILHTKKEVEHPVAECDFFKSITQILRHNDVMKSSEIECIHHTTQLCKYGLKTNKVRKLNRKDMQAKKKGLATTGLPSFISL
jgi:hypothetical protein